jgi:hypothetical protein
VHLGRLVIDDAIDDKLRRKHNITFQDVVEAIQWPAHAEAGWEFHPDYGWRVVAYGTVAAGRGVICYLKPLPEWDDYADTWEVRTARWVD